MKELLARMAREARLARPLARQIDEYERLRQDAASNTYLLEKLLPRIRRTVEGLSAVSARAGLDEWLVEQETHIRGLKDDFRFRFGEELRLVLSGNGFTLSGQFPLLRAGRYTIRLDFELGHARVYWGPEVELLRSRVKLAASEIAKFLTGFETGLKGAESSPEPFMRTLLQAYDRCRQRAGLTPDARLALVDLMAEMVMLRQPRKFALNPTRDNFREYSRVQFSHDLYRLKQSPVRSIDGRQLKLAVATFDSTVTKMKALWVPDNESGDGTWYSQLAFPAEEG